MVYSAYSVAQPIEPSKRAQELVAYLNKYSIAKPPKDVINLSQGMTDLYVDQVLTQLGQANSDWNKENPSWKRLESTIRKDINNYQQDRLTHFKTIREKWDQELALGYDQELGSAGIEYLLNFYSSSSGKNYLKFSTSTDMIMNSCATTFERMKMNGEHLSPPSIKEEQVAWSKRLDLMLKGFTARAADSSHNIGVIQYLGNLALGCALIKGKELDEIDKAIEMDLSEIDKYIASEYAIKELAFSTSNATRFAKQFSLDYENWLKAKQDSWKSMYVELTRATTDP